MCPGLTWPIWWMSTRADEQLLQVLWSMQHFYLLLQLHLQPSIHHQSITMPSVNRCLFLCMYHVHVMFVPFIWCQHQNNSRLTASRCSFQSLIKYHLLKAALSHSAFFFIILILILNGGRQKWEKDSRKKERSWVMDALCLSVIPNYWTLPFKATLHFSFLPLWLMKSRLWLGGSVF